MSRLKDQNKIIAIHQATIDLVTKTGFSALKMAAVAKKSGIATGTLYIYYSSKEELVNNVYVETKKEIARAIVDPKCLEQDFYEAFKAMWYNYFRFCLKNRAKIVFVEQFIYCGYISEENNRITESYFKILGELFLNGQKQGIIKDIHIGIIKAYIQGPIYEVIKKNNHCDIEYGKETIDICFLMVWDSIKK